ncbi:hypothetical protein [Streptomyces sp. NPDC059009]
MRGPIGVAARVLGQAHREALGEDRLGERVQAGWARSMSFPTWASSSTS